MRLKHRELQTRAILGLGDLAEAPHILAVRDMVNRATVGALEWSGDWSHSEEWGEDPGKLHREDI